MNIHVHATKLILVASAMILTSIFLSFGGAKLYAQQKQEKSAKTTSHVRQLLTELKVPNPEDYFLNDEVIRRIETEWKLSIEDEEARKIIAEDFYSGLSNETLARVMRGLTRPELPNVLILGNSGVGKTSLLVQMVAMYGLGIIPHDLAKRLNLIDPQSTAQVDAKSFFGRTHIVKVNRNLLTRDKQSAKHEAFLSAEDRMRRTLELLFDAARKDYLGEENNPPQNPRRTIFVFDEVAQLPPEVLEALNPLLDKSGYNPVGSVSLRSYDPGYHVIAMTTPTEYQRMETRDPSALERRFVRVNIFEPTEEEIFKLAHARATIYGTPRGIKVKDSAIQYLIRMRHLLNWPSLSAPASVLSALGDLIQWKTQHPSENKNSNPYVISLRDAQRFVIGRVGLSDTWVESGDGRPPFHDLASRVKKEVIGHDEIVDDMSRTLRDGRS